MKNLKLALFITISLVSPHLLTAQQTIEDNANRGLFDKNITHINRLLKDEPGTPGPEELVLLKAEQFYLKAVHQNFPFDSATALVASLTKSVINDKVQSGILQLTGQLEYFKAFETGDFLISRKYFQKSLAIHKETNDYRGESESLFYIGLTYEQSDSPDSAGLFYKKSYQLAQQHQLKKEQSYAARHLGSISETFNNKTDAHKYYEESLQLRIEARYDIGVPYSYMTLADLIKTENPSKAISLYKKALEVAEQCNILRAQVMALNTLGDFNNSDCKKSVPYFTKAQQLSAMARLYREEERAKNGLLQCKK